MKVVYDWLKDYVGEEIPPIEKLEELFTFHAFEIDGTEKIGKHDVIDVKVLPDRSSDCLCHRGVAHELAALIGKPLTKDPLHESTVLEPKTGKLSVVIENAENCKRFSAALMVGIEIKESPEWLKQRLEALGQRSINNVVDATNYVMLALGQPLHAYDAEKFPRDETGWHFGVRMARDGEEVTTLSNETFICTPRVQFITDARGDIPVGIAGVKGGKYAEINTKTTDIILEAANFDPVVTRRSSQTLKLQTDASKRFENNLPPELTAYGLRDCVALILEIAGGTCEGYLDNYPTRKGNPVVLVPYAQLTGLLGLTILKSDTEAILSRLGFMYEKIVDGWTVTAPFERTDVTIAEDVIAEVGRVYGYEHVASVVPETVPLTEYNARHYYSEQIRAVLVAEGFSEVITSSFRKKDEIELANALASDKGHLRSSLCENIKEVLDRNMPNVDLLGLSNVEVFEIGTVFHKHESGKGVVEHVALAIGVRQKQTGYSPKDDARLTDVLTKIESLLGIPCGATIKDGILECNLTELIEKLPKPTSYPPYTPESDTHFTAYSQYPFVSRDIALWVPEGTTKESIETLLRGAAGELLTLVTCFDEFHKDGKISYAFRLIFQSFDRTLTDEDVGEVMGKITSVLTNQGYMVR